MIDDPKQVAEYKAKLKQPPPIISTAKDALRGWRYFREYATKAEAAHASHLRAPAGGSISGHKAYIRWMAYAEAAEAWEEVDSG